MPDTPQQIVQVIALDTLHGNKMLSLRFCDVEHATDVGMRNFPRDANLVVHPPQPVGIMDAGGGKKLQRHPHPELQIIRLIDLAHAALADAINHPVAIGNHLPGQESPPGNKRLSGGGSDSGLIFNSRIGHVFRHKVQNTLKS